MTENEKIEAELTELDEGVDVPVTKRSKTWLYIAIVILVLGIIIAGIVLLAGAGNETTAQVRDIFIILMALISVALIILIIQIAALINLLQNEIKPILKSTNDTVNTLRGTSTFLSENLASPVIKINSSIAGLRKLLDLAGLFKK